MVRDDMIISMTNRDAVGYKVALGVHFERL